MPGNPRTLAFVWGEIRPLLEHTRNAGRWSGALGEQVQAVFDKGLVEHGDTFKALDMLFEHPDVLKDHNYEPGLFIVGDAGVYLMSAGEPGLLLNDDPANLQHHVVFAEGCNPDRDPEWHDTKRATFGGDDAADKLSLALFEEMESRFQPEDDDRFVVEFQDNRMTFTIQKPWQ